VNLLFGFALLLLFLWAVPIALGNPRAHHTHASHHTRHHRTHRGHKANDSRQRGRTTTPATNTQPTATGQTTVTTTSLPSSTPTSRTAATKTAPGESVLPDVGIAAGASLQTWTVANVDRELDDYVNLHGHWIRHDFAWDAIEYQQGVFTWSGFDQWVSAARARNLNVIATISYAPPWANGGNPNHDYQPTSPDQFGQFAGEVAARYAPQGVHTYEIWNEPNIGFWQPGPNPAYYTQVLCSAYRYIHAADPHATVLTGGTSPAGDGASSYSPQTWLTDLYANGGGSCFDAVAHHPYVDSSPVSGELGNAWQLMSSEYAPSNLRAIMLSHGDSAKRIWATEVGCNRSALGDSECSARIAAALRLWQTYSWAGVLCWFTYWDPNVYGLVDGNWTPRPEWYAYQAAASAYP
jgi:hypothetical protein